MVEIGVLDDEDAESDSFMIQGARLTVERLRVIPGWAWSVEDMNGVVAAGVEPGAGEAKGEAARQWLWLDQVARIRARQDD